MNELKRNRINGMIAQIKNLMQEINDIIEQETGENNYDNLQYVFGDLQIISALLENVTC